VPESIIPSADAIGPFGLKGISFQMLTCHTVLLPESFRGGCSFGAGPNGAGLSRRDVFQRRHKSMRSLNLSTRFRHLSTALCCCGKPLIRLN